VDGAVSVHDVVVVGFEWQQQQREATAVRRLSCAALVEDDPTERLMIVRVVGDTAADNNDDG
jgi:hypothetical protein